MNSNEHTGKRADTRETTRRTFLRGVTALGTVALSTTAATSVQAAGESRTSYQIMEGSIYETTVHIYDSGTDGPTTFVTGGIHGDERSGYMAAEEILNWTVDTGKLVVIPRSNVPAIEAGTRHGPLGDLNRKFPPRSGECYTELACALWDEVVKHDPDWAFDLHSARGIYKSGDGSVGQALFPTWTRPARACGEHTVADLNDEFGLTGEMCYLMGNTLDADRKMLMHRIAGYLDIPGFICETTEKADSLEDQIQWHLYTVEHVMNQYGQKRVTDVADAVTEPVNESVNDEQEPDSAGESESTEPSDPVVTAANIAVDDPWAEFSLDDGHADPVVVAKPLSIVGSDPCHPRLRGVADGAFECHIEEWANGNGKHYQEETGMCAIDAGVHTLDDGRRMEVGTVETDTEATVVRFSEQFAKQPVVLAQPQTENESTPVVARIRGPWTDGFEASIQMEESKTSEEHDPETVGWMAVERGAGTIDGQAFEANVERSVKSAWHHIEFEESYDNPVFVGGIQSLADKQPCGLRYKNLTSSGVDVFVEEEDSADVDRTHGEEEVGYFVFEG